MQGINPWSGDSEILDLRINTIPGEDMLDNSEDLEEGTPEEEELPGVYYRNHKQEIEWNETHTHLYNLEDATLKARHTTMVNLKLGKPRRENQPIAKETNDVLIIPKMNNEWMNRHEMFAQPGVVTRKGDEAKIFLTNLRNDDQILPAGCHVGHVLEAARFTTNAVSAVPDRSRTISKEEMKYHRQFIIRQLELDSNPILQQDPEAMEEAIQIFLDGWDAVSTTETDFGKTDTVKFYIELEPGAKPVHDRVRPLNPMQEADLRWQIDEWLEAGVIEPSGSAWSSALVPCKKKGTDKFRWAIDYRRLNLLTVKDV